MSCPDVLYLKDILGDGGDKDISSILLEINKNISELKGELHSTIQEKRIILKTILRENNGLCKQALDLENQIKTVKEVNDKLIGDAKQSSDEILNLSTAFIDINSTISVLEKLLSIHNDIHQVQILLKQKQFNDSAEIVARILGDVKDSNDLRGVVIFKKLGEEIVLLRERILFEIAEYWSSCVKISVEGSSSKSTVCIYIEQERMSSLKDIIKTSFFMNDPLIERRLFIRLKENILLPIVFHPCEIAVDISEVRSILKVNFNKTLKDPSYLQVFERIIDVIGFLKSQLNVELQDGSDLMSKLGKFMAQELTNVLMEHCLSEILPSQPGQLKAYGEIIANTEKLQSTLQEFGFLPSGCSPLMDPADDVNVLFANRIYLSYLERAREIAKNDLHSTVTCSEIAVQDWNVFPSHTLKLIVEKLNLSDEKQIFIPKCQISKSAQDIINLVEAIMKEIDVSQEGRRVKLLYTIRNILEIFSALVPLHHRKLLETIPQQVAIFHNNCIHFAFRLLLLTSQCQKETSLRDHCHILLDQAVALRQLGVQSLENSVSNQRSHLIYILRASGLGTLNEAPKLDPGCEKAVRQCMRQLQLLRNVWGEILPDNVFTNAMGFLVDVFTEEMVNLVLSAEDISSRSATDLVEIFKIVQDRIPTLFSDAREVFRLCRKWGRFLELIFVLGANLGGISNRWADGLGPLACEFTTEQMKHLVRALFQNTEQRASLIAKIK